MIEKLKVMTNYFKQDDATRFDKALQEAGFQVIQTPACKSFLEEETDDIIIEAKPNILVYDPINGLTKEDKEKGLDKLWKQGTRKFAPLRMGYDICFQIFGPYMRSIDYLATELDIPIIALSVVPPDEPNFGELLKEHYGHRYLYLPKTSEQDLVAKVIEMTKAR